MDVKWMVYVIWLLSPRVVLAQSTFAEVNTAISIVNRLANTDDGGFIVIGTDADQDACIVKYTANGQVEWTRAFGGNWDDMGSHVIQTQDGGYAFTGGIDRRASQNELIHSSTMLVKLSRSGDLEWSRQYNGSYLYYDALGLIETADGGYVITGRAGFYVHLFKVDSTGAYQWSRLMGPGQGRSSGCAVLEISDGCLAVAGWVYLNRAQEQDIFLAKFTGTGELEWCRTIGVPGMDLGLSLIQVTDGFVIGGVSGNVDALIIRFNSSGDLLWTREIGGPDDDRTQSVVQAPDGGYVLTGMTQSFGNGDYDLLIMKLSEAGDLEWFRTTGASQHEFGGSIVVSPEGGYVIAGGTESYSVYEKNLFLVKYDSLGNSCIQSGEDYKATFRKSHFYQTSLDTVFQDDTIRVTTPACGIKAIKPVITDICDLINEHKAPIPILYQVMVDNVPVNVPDNTKCFVLQSSPKNISIGFTAIYPDPKQKKLFRYVLKGSKDQWETTTSDRTADFTFLQPDRYTFSVSVMGGNGVWGDPQDMLSFRILPPMWRRAAFLIPIMTGTALVSCGLFFLRIRGIRNKAQLEQQIAETEMTALRAQMNPHFIFNCINNIDALIQNNDKDEATRYLNKFAKLIRRILDSSRHSVVPLSRDLETLQLYIELEQFRQGNRFEVVVKSDEALLHGDYHVPPMVMQPFVENAILHGLYHRTAPGGRLSVNLLRSNGHIRYIIEDNGVGRKTATSMARSERHSYGIQMSLDRIRLFNDEDHASVEIIDLVSDGRASGTRVEVLLKVK